LRKQILIEGVQRKIAKDIVIPPEEITAAYEQKKADYEAQLRASHILVCDQLDQSNRNCNISPNDEELARSISVRARAGEDFAVLARQYSRDNGTSGNAGDLGWFGKNAFVPAFEEAAYALQPGQISDPVKTQFGYHVIKLVSKGRSLEDAKEEIQEQLARPRQQEAFQKWLEEKLTTARIRVNPQYGRYDSITQSVVGASTR
ncbi:MAG: peptidylprolyl isomerase, partial [Acidimicrobiia bacterium]